MIVFTVVASYTYGPLLGLYAFGLFMKSKTVHDKLVPVVSVVAPLITFWINSHATEWFSGYVFSVEIIIVNGLITFLGLLLISKSTQENTRY